MAAERAPKCFVHSVHISHSVHIIHIVDSVHSIHIVHSVRIVHILYIVDSVDSVHLPNPATLSRQRNCFRDDDWRERGRTCEYPKPKDGGD